AGALHLHRQPVGAQVVQERRPLALWLGSRREPRIERHIHPHAGTRPVGGPPFWHYLGLGGFRHGYQAATPARRRAIAAARPPAGNSAAGPALTPVVRSVFDDL